MFYVKLISYTCRSNSSTILVCYHGVFSGVNVNLEGILKSLCRRTQLTTEAPG